MMCKVAIISVLVALTLHSLTTATPVAAPQTTVVGSVQGAASNVTSTAVGLANGTVSALNETVVNAVGVVDTTLAGIIATLTNALSKVTTVADPLIEFLGLPALAG